MESSTDFAKPIYLVARLLSKERANFLFKVEAAAVAGGDEPLLAHTVAQLPGGRHGKSFVATHSEEGSWIVGIGGLGGGTVIYDPSTMETFRGPELTYPKRMPILISLQSKVYAISRHPRVIHKSKFDFEPWFESLSFRKGVPCIFNDDCPSWKPLPPPPFFPCLLDPMEFRNPPSVSVSSYAAFGSHILISLDCKETGTYAFDVVNKTWEKVCNESLPFVGQAVPLGGSLFAACCTTDNNVSPVATLFHMSMTSTSTLAASGKLTTSLISILEYPVVAEGDPLPLFCPMGKGRFCSISSGSYSQGSDDTRIVLTSFEIEDIDAVLAAFQTESAKGKDLQVPVQVKHQNQIYELHGPFKVLPMSVIASLCMDKKVTELSEEKRTKTRVRKADTSNIFEAVHTVRRRA